MGVSRFVLTDNTKSAVLRRDLEGHPVWQKGYETFMQDLSFETKLCKPRHPFTKGKVERLVCFVEENFLADRVFYDLADLNWRRWSGETNRTEPTAALWTVYLKNFMKLYMERSCAWFWRILSDSISVQKESS